MKTKLILIIQLFTTLIFSQSKVDSSNYFDSHSNGQNLKGSKINTIWLNKLDVAPIVSEEMKKAGYSTSEFRIIKLDSGQHVIALVYSEKARFGFLFEGTHGMFPVKKNRYIKSMYKTQTGNDYAEKIVSVNGESDFIKIKNLPSNLIILKADCYWYQQTDNPKDDKTLVTKEDIIYVLRQDIQKILQSAPAPTK